MRKLNVSTRMKTKKTKITENKPKYKANFFGVLSHIINPLLTKLVRSRWLDIGLVLFCEFMDLDFVSVHKHAKKELGKYPAILTSRLVNNPAVIMLGQLKQTSKLITIVVCGLVLTHLIGCFFVTKCHINIFRFHLRTVICVQS